jgi:hypothetical protein
MELCLTVSYMENWEEANALITQTWLETFSDPLKETWFLVRIPTVSFPKPGKYICALSAAGEDVAHTTFELEEV